MADIQFKVKASEFEPTSADGQAGEKVKFINDRHGKVTITLDPNFYETGSLEVPGKSNNHVFIKSDATGTGSFSTPTAAAGVRQDTMNGDVTIQPKK